MVSTGKTSRIYKNKLQKEAFYKQTVLSLEIHWLAWPTKGTGVVYVTGLHTFSESVGGHTIQ